MLHTPITSSLVRVSRPISRKGAEEVHRRLRRPWPVQRRDNILADVPETSLAGQGAADPREPRVEGSNPSTSPRLLPQLLLIHVRHKTYGFYTECVRKYGSSHVWTYFTDMFDFLTLSVVIDDKIFCVHGGTFVLSLSSLYAVTSPAAGLSPSIHSIDQIKVVDRFRGTPYVFPFSLSPIEVLTVYQRFRTKAPWPTLYGQIRIRRRKTLQYLHGNKACPTSPPTYSATDGTDRCAVALATRSDRASSTSFWRRTRCPTSCAHISYVWKATLHYSTSISPRCGPRQTTATDVATPLASSRWARAARCSSTCSRLPRRTSETVPAIRPRRTREERYVLMHASPPSNVHSLNARLPHPTPLSRPAVARVLLVIYAAMEQYPFRRSEVRCVDVDTSPGCAVDLMRRGCASTHSRHLLLF